MSFATQQRRITQFKRKTIALSDDRQAMERRKRAEKRRRRLTWWTRRILYVYNTNKMISFYKSVIVIVNSLAVDKHN